jgi:peptidoglycan/xylan/chitin deacetylase (PgdA/CDA1 family)
MRQRLKKLICGNQMLLRVVNTISDRLPRVLVYHRFAAPDAPVPHRVNAATFAWQLDTIKKNFDVITFGECITRFLQQGAWPEGCVILTIDDGYADMYQYAWPELAKRNLPATFFVTTAFVDGTLWLWPDRLEYALLKTDCTECNITISEKQITLSLNTNQERSVAWMLCSDHCISLQNSERLAFIKQLEEQLEIEPPLAPPPEYAAVTWEQLQEMQAGGIEIGGHTTNHPILSKIPPELLDDEIGQCRKLIQEHLDTPINSFCYTNSGPGDINDAVIAAVVKAGYSGAVFGTNLAAWGDRYQVPRMGISDDQTDFIWKLCGGESLTCRRT